MQGQGISIESYLPKKRRQFPYHIRNLTPDLPGFSEEAQLYVEYLIYNEEYQDDEIFWYLIEKDQPDLIANMIDQAELAFIEDERDLYSRTISLFYDIKALRNLQEAYSLITDQEEDFIAFLGSAVGEYFFMNNKTGTDALNPFVISGPYLMVLIEELFIYIADNKAPGFLLPTTRRVYAFMTKYFKTELVIDSCYRLIEEYLSSRMTSETRSRITNISVIIEELIRLLPQTRSVSRLRQRYQNALAKAGALN